MRNKRRNPAARAKEPAAIYCTSYCNHGHRVDDGVPVEHECYVLPPAALAAEMEGDYERAQFLLAGTNKRAHRGVKA